MIDKINNINTSSVQNKRAGEEAKSKDAPSIKRVVENKNNSADADNIDISTNSGITQMARSAPIDLDKVSAIKSALAKGDYPVDLEKVADALLQAYKDIK